MATFRYLGFAEPSCVKTPGNKTKIRVWFKDGTKHEFTPQGKPSFEVGDTIEVTDERVIRHLSADSRFELVP